MLVRVPGYFDRFSCLAGACPHSCCVGWEVVIDPDTAARYQAMTGPLGDRLRAAMALDGEDVCFPLNGGRCPFLNEEGLCDIHCALGAEATSVTCQEHPRFIEDYGAFKEIALSVSCPKANELLLGSQEPLDFLEREDGQIAEEGDGWLGWLVPLRARMLAILRDRSRPLDARLRDFLLLAQAAQEDIEEEQTGALMALAKNWQPDTSVAADGTTGLFPEALRSLQRLETLEPDWQDLLRQGETATDPPLPEPLLERITVYFAFRYLLKAVNDGDLLGRAELCVFAVLVIRRLAAVCGLPEALRRFSCEIEHDEDNIGALLEGFAWEESLSLERFLGELERVKLCAPC